MGTNYYARRIASEEDKKYFCDLISKDQHEELKELLPQDIHLGKSSTGWEFCFDHNNWEYFEETEESVRAFINSCEIVDEYGRSWTPEEFWEKVESTRGGLNHEKYMESWFEIHPDSNSRPYYADEPQDFLVGSLRFSKHSDFS